MKSIYSVFFALFTAGFLAVNVYAGDVSYYRIFQDELSSGISVNITPSDIIKSSTDTAITTTINISTSVSITGNGRIIDINSVGNMFTSSATGITVTVSSVNVLRGNSILTNGGAINMVAVNTRLNVDGVSSFNSNRSGFYGGAIYAGVNSNLVFTGNTSFSNNSAVLDGGAVYLSAGSNANFSGTVLTASSNSTVSSNGGFLSAVSAGTITFGTATFTGNTATSVTTFLSGYGGAIYSYGNTNMNFTGNTSFINNSAYSAGAMFITTGTIATFSGTNTLFQGNQSMDAVGALLVRHGAGVIFQGENTIFKNNFMTNNAFGTGAVDIAYNASADFTGTNLTAQQNNAGNGGKGGFLWSDSSRVLFGNVLIGGEYAGDGNIAYYGGGIFTGNRSTMTFTGSNTMFRNNIAYADGGAMYITTNSVVTFNAGSSTNTVFQNNIAINKGGAAFVTAVSTLSFQGAGTSFYDNSASIGGAISIEDGGTVEITNGNFVRNAASLAGGAVYLNGSNSARTAVFRSYTTAAGEGRTVFYGNTAGGARNAFYLDEYSRAYFHTDAGTSVEMLDGISGSNNITTYFEVAGAGDFNLYGTFDTLDLHVLGRFNLMEGSLMDANTVNVNIGARFSMQNDIADTAYMKALNSSGTIALDIISPRQNDRIIVSGNMNLNSIIPNVLELKADDMTDINFRKRIYKLINYESYTGGGFSTATILSPAAPSSYVLGYGDAYADWVTLSIYGNQNSTEFGRKIKLDSFNQKETAKALDKISETVVNNSEWDLALADIEAYDNDSIKKILSHLAGYFLPNIIRNAAADSPNNEIYDRIKNHCVENHLISNGIWVQARAGIETFYENDNSIGDYKDTSAGIMAGYDRYMEDLNLMLGIYGRYNSDSIEQGKNKADGTKTGVGIYGGYIKQDWELKALTLGSFDSFEAKRYIYYSGATAESEIKTVTLSFDVEGALKFDMTAYTKFRPYAGFELANASYGGFKEKGAGIFNLDVDGGNYLRTSGRAGAGLQYEKDIWNWYANLESRLLFSGTEPEIENVFSGTNAKFKTRGAKEGAFEIGIGIGGALRLTKSLKIFANANYYGADKYQNMYGNIGIRYTFCKASAAAIYDPSLYDEEEPRVSGKLKSEDIDMFDERIVEEQKLEAQKRREKPVLKSYSLNMASFDVDKSDLKPAAKKDIEREADEIKQFDYNRIIIEGHTDSTGSDAHNKELSKARAKAVFDEFALHGIPGDKMYYIGFGSTMPRDTNSTEKGRAQNRRVEIFVE
ncbi:MAG: autotransporter domain-containing protein [Endomicrobia bacterium]|nr:autotransporter domain-containing protein [Endomicrobiia bacterium]